MNGRSQAFRSKKVTMKTRILIVAICAACAVSAQDLFFMNQNQSLLATNPSFAGSNGGLRAQLGYRNQWPNLSGRYVCYYAAVDGYVKPLKAGIGLSALTNDQA